MTATSETRPVARIDIGEMPLLKKVWQSYDWVFYCLLGAAGIHVMEVLYRSHYFTEFFSVRTLATIEPFRIIAGFGLFWAFRSQKASFLKIWAVFIGFIMVSRIMLTWWVGEASPFSIDVHRLISGFGSFDWFQFNLVLSLGILLLTIGLNATAFGKTPEKELAKMQMDERAKTEAREKRAETRLVIISLATFGIGLFLGGPQLVKEFSIIAQGFDFTPFVVLGGMFVSLAISQALYWAYEQCRPQDASFRLRVVFGVIIGLGAFLAVGSYLELKLSDYWPAALFVAAFSIAFGENIARTGPLEAFFPFGFNLRESRFVWHPRCYWLLMIPVSVAINFGLYWGYTYAMPTFVFAWAIYNIFDVVLRIGNNWIMKEDFRLGHGLGMALIVYGTFLTYAGGVAH